MIRHIPEEHHCCGLKGLNPLLLSHRRLQIHGRMQGLLFMSINVLKGLIGFTCWKQKLKHFSCLRFGSILFLYAFLRMWLTSHPTAAPTPDTAVVAAPDRPAAPIDCKVATRPPAATPPPLAIAADDIMPAAYEPAAIPAEVKPMTPRTRGIPRTATTAPAPAPTPTATAAFGSMSLRSFSLLGRLSSHTHPQQGCICGATLPAVCP